MVMWSPEEVVGVYITRPYLAVIADNQFSLVGASKGGLDMLTKVMGLELGAHKVRVQRSSVYQCIIYCLSQFRFV